MILSKSLLNVNRKHGINRNGRVVKTVWLNKMDFKVISQVVTIGINQSHPSLVCLIKVSRTMFSRQRNNSK